MAADVIILQRVVPHYREALFEALHERYGWLVACAGNPLREAGLKINPIDRPYIRRFTFGEYPLGSVDIVTPPVGQIIDTLQPKVIVCEFSMYMSSSYVLAWRRRFGRAPKLAFHTHGYNMERGFHGSAGLIERVKLPVLRSADMVLCYSEEGKAFLDRHCDPGKVKAVGNSVDITEIQSLKDQVAPHGAKGWPRILSIGRVNAIKDFSRLVRCFKKLRAVFPEAQLAIIGDGSDLEHVRAEAGRLLGQAIELPGQIYEEEQLAAYFAWADLVVFPGSVGLSVNHSLAYGVPVMTYARTKTGPHHHPELAYVVDGVTGWQVGPYTDDALTQAMINLFRRDPSPRRSMAEGIERFVRQHLTIDSIVERFGEVNKLLAS